MEIICVYIFLKYLFRNRCVPNTVLGIRETVVNKTEFLFSQTINQSMTRTFQAVKCAVWKISGDCFQLMVTAFG